MDVVQTFLPAENLQVEYCNSHKPNIDYGSVSR